MYIGSLRVLGNLVQGGPGEISRGWEPRASGETEHEGSHRMKKEVLKSRPLLSSGRDVFGRGCAVDESGGGMAGP